MGIAAYIENIIFGKYQKKIIEFSLLLNERAVLLQLKDSQIRDMQNRINSQNKDILQLSDELMKEKNKNKIGVVDIKISEWIGKTDILWLLKNSFPKAEIFLSDEKYGLITKEQLTSLLFDDKTNTRKYVAETYDCDNFSYSLIGNLSGYGIPLGLLWISEPYSHAVNVVVLKDEKTRWKVWIIEPQTDAIFTKPKEYKEKIIVM